MVSISSTKDWNERRFKILERSNNEQAKYERMNKKNGISPERLRELQRMAQGNPFADRIVVNKSWHQIG